MNKNIKTYNFSIGMGGSLIITIFVVLCLTVFSFLSFTTAYSDLKLAKKTEEFNYDYYETHGMAQEKLAEIHVVLMSINESIDLENKKEAFINNAAKSVVDVYGVSVVNLNEDSFNIYYEVLGNKNQKLCVTLKIEYNTEKNIPYYDIITWNVQPIEIPNYEEEIYNLWEGFE